MSWSRNRIAAVTVLALILGTIGGISWHAHKTSAPVAQSFGAVGNYAFPVGPATLNGVACGTYPNLVCDGGAVAQPNAVTIGPAAGDGGAVTYAMLAGDRFANMDTSAGLVATATLGNATGKGTCHTFRWWNWNDAMVPPAITSDAGMIPFAGPSTGGAAGLVTSTSITTPGSPFTLCADGQEWVTQ